ncbi:MAG: hypothetical protein K2Q03_08105 [Sphingobacteriaceae bacterium]|nr:hypothetical protein [Sphingobacteriaceae bacterium]
MKNKVLLISAFLGVLFLFSCKKDALEELGDQGANKKIQNSESSILDSLKNPDFINKQNAINHEFYEGKDTVVKFDRALAIRNLEKNLGVDIKEDSVRVVTNRGKKLGLVEDIGNFFVKLGDAIVNVINPAIWAKSFYKILEDLYNSRDVLDIFLKVYTMSPKGLFFQTAIGVLDVAEGPSISNSVVKKVFSPSYSGTLFKVGITSHSLVSDVKNKNTTGLFTTATKLVYNVFRGIDPKSFTLNNNIPNTMTTLLGLNFPQGRNSDNLTDISEFKTYLQSENKMYSMNLVSDKILITKIEGGKETIVSQIDMIEGFTKIYMSYQLGVVLCGKYEFARDNSPAPSGYHYTPYSSLREVHKTIFSLPRGTLCAVMLKNNGSLVFMDVKNNREIFNFYRGFYGNIDGTQHFYIDEEFVHGRFYLSLANLNKLNEYHKQENMLGNNAYKEQVMIEQRFRWSFVVEYPSGKITRTLGQMSPLEEKMFKGGELDSWLYNVMKNHQTKIEYVDSYREWCRKQQEIIKFVRTEVKENVIFEMVQKLEDDRINKIKKEFRKNDSEKTKESLLNDAMNWNIVHRFTPNGSTNSTYFEACNEIYKGLMKARLIKEQEEARKQAQLKIEREMKEKAEAEERAKARLIIREQNEKEHSKYIYEKFYKPQIDAENEYIRKEKERKELIQKQLEQDKIDARLREEARLKKDLEYKQLQERLQREAKARGAGYSSGPKPIYEDLEINIPAPVVNVPAKIFIRRY